jgi:hypothetical protein
MRRSRSGKLHAVDFEYEGKEILLISFLCNFPGPKTAAPRSGAMSLVLDARKCATRILGRRGVGPGPDGPWLQRKTMTDVEVLTRLDELEREAAYLRRQNEQLRETIRALLAPPPANDKERLWQKTHPRAQ